MSGELGIARSGTPDIGFSFDRTLSWSCGEAYPKVVEAVPRHHSVHELLDGSILFNDPRYLAQQAQDRWVVARVGDLVPLRVRQFVAV